MKRFLKRALSAMLAAVLLVTAVPVETSAAAGSGGAQAEKLELSDDYLKMTVSGENGGFLIDTVKGNQLKKSDDNKFLLYPSEEYDTSYTSFRVTYEDGKQKDYIFGRKYGFLGFNSSDVALSQEGNSLVAVWSVDQITIQQKLSLLDETATQHGMVSIEYSVQTEREDIQDIKARIMLDTALGYQDYGVYEVPSITGDYAHIKRETLLDNSDGNAYSGTFFAVDDPSSPGVTAYTVNTTIGGQMVRPYQIGFGHWNNLASTVFDFVPDENLDFTNPYNEEYMTDDSAYALWFDMGTPVKGESTVISTYYGVYSNASVSEDEKVAINFPVLPASMTLNETQDAYLPQAEGGTAGDISARISIENISSQPMENMTVVIKTQNLVRPYRDWETKEFYEDENESFTMVFEDYQPDETEQLDVYFNVTPLIVSEYRSFEVLCYAAGRNEELTEQKLLGSREFYLFCPGELGETVLFHSIEPQMIYTEGTRNIYLSGMNFSLLRDTSAYTAYLKPLSGGENVIVPGRNVVVDAEKNTLYLQVESSMTAGSYQVVFDWNEAGKEDTTSPILQFMATDEPEYIAPVYGIVTVEKSDAYYRSDLTNGDADPAYCLKAYADEAEYSDKVKDPNNKVLLEFRGDFSLWYDEDGNVTEAKAVSLEDVKGNISGTINISNCLDVEAGTVSIVVNDPATEDQSIDVNIDGEVYTTNSRTKVWSGVCAISSFVNGDKSTLLQYDYDGEQTGNLENSVANTNAITLMWPGAASGMQTLAGMLFEFRYGQFGMMATEPGTPNDQTPKQRVIAFGAEMSPDFLLPTNYDWSERNTSALEVAQLKLAKSNYTPSQLRDVQARYAQDQADWEEASGGSLSLYVHDILFGGGFVGFHSTVEVGLPSYADGLPEVEGSLNLKVFPRYQKWAIGLDGTADFTMLKMEASLELKSYKGVPIPNKFYFYVEGEAPGINLDGFGVFWIKGLGGGIDNLYDTIFVVSKVPPLKLMLSGAFSLFNLMDAGADLSLSLRGYDVTLKDLELIGIPLIEEAGVSTYWYPKLRFYAGVEVDILSMINGGGSIIVEENTKDGSIFWEGLVHAAIQTPKIPLIGVIKIGSAELGINPAKIWGALHVLLLDMGVTYYWGGDVDFAIGKYDTPESTVSSAYLADVPVYTDAETGKVLYMRMGTNAMLAASSVEEVTETQVSRVGGGESPSIESSVDRMKHILSLGSYTGMRDIALTVHYDADSQAEAEKLRKQMTLKDENGTAYPLTWFDAEKVAEEQPTANALFNYDEETKQASLTISFTQEESFAHQWTLQMKKSCDVALYQMKRLPGLDSVSYTYTEAQNQLNVSWQGSQLEKLEKLSVYAAAEDGTLYPLFSEEDYADIQKLAADPKVEITIPDTLPSGSYEIQVVASSEAESVNDAASAEIELQYINKNQPADPTVTKIRLGGDYSIDVTVAENTDCDGYIATIYEKQADGTLVETEFGSAWISKDAMEEDGNCLTLGGRNTTFDEDGNEKIVGLEAGKTYQIGVRAYRMTADETDAYQSEETLSDPITMKEPDPAELTVTVEGAKKLTEALTETESYEIELITEKQFTVDEQTGKNQLTLQVVSDQAVSGSWYVDDQAVSGTWAADPTGTITLTEREAADEFEKDFLFTEGDHRLTLQGENANGDAVRYQYLFRVDCSAPRLQLEGPENGSFFTETVVVKGLSEPGAKISIQVEENEPVTLTVGADGSFSQSIDFTNAVNSSLLEQQMTIWAEDEAGNQSRAYTMTLTNAVVGAKDANLAIYMDDINVTGQVIPAGSSGALELRIVSAASEKSVKIPANSNIGRQAEWSTETVEGTASVTDGVLLTDLFVNGMLLVSLNDREAGAVLGGNRQMNGQTYQMILPETTETDGYMVNAMTATEVADGGSFTFRVEIKEGYTADDDFAVSVNGVSVTGIDGQYTITDIHSQKTITVTGVRDLTAPELQIAVDDDENTFWEAFLNVITFRLFFNEDQEVTLTASDAGSGLADAGVKYYLAEEAMTLEEVKALAEDQWNLYDGTFSIGEERQYVIYAKAADKSGNRTYVSSDGLILDKTAPTVTTEAGSLTDGAVYYGDQTLVITDQDVEQIQADGTDAVLTDGKFTIPADNAKHTIVVTDKAGNRTKYTITVYKVYQITFMADNTEVAVVDVSHGSGLTGEKFPQIPVKEGYNQTAPVWEVGALKNVTEDQTIHAVYTINKYTVTLPETTKEYTIRTEQKTVEHGGSFTFSVEIADGYVKGKNFKVLVDGTQLQAGKDGTYTVKDVTAAVQIEVKGVKKAVVKEPGKSEEQSKPTQNQSAVKPTEASPSTGDLAEPMLYVSVLLVSVIGLLWIYKKKRVK